MAEPRTVLIIQGIGEIGGAEQELLVLLPALAARGFRPVVACPAEGPLAGRLQALGLAVRHLEFPPWRKPRGWLRRAGAVRQLRRLIDKERPVLVHVNEMWWLPQTLRAVGRERPVIVHMRQEIEPAKVRRYEVAQTDLVLVMSRAIGRAVEASGVSPDRIRTVHGGIDLTALSRHRDGAAVRARYGIPLDAFVMGTVAHLFPRKGYEVWLQALASRAMEFAHDHVLIIGQGDAGHERKLRALAARHPLAGRIHFAGFQDRVSDYLAAMDLYVHPALMEGFGIAILEAMASGLAVVATRTGGIPDMVEEGVTGRLVAPGDAQALAEAVLEARRDEPGRQAMGQAARERVAREFTIAHLTARVADAFGHVLHRWGEDIPVTAGAHNPAEAS